jgi:hypothetical protein
MAIAAVAMSFISERWAPAITYGFSAINLIVVIILVGRIASVLSDNRGLTNLTLAPKLAIRDGGIEVLPRLLRNGHHFAWSQVQWRTAPGDILWLKLEDKWLRVCLADYDVGALLPELLRERCPEAPLPIDKMEVFTSPWLTSTTRLQLQWIDNTLRTGPGRLDLSKPYEASLDKSGTLNLTQGPTLVEIHPHDPRRPLIEALPEVARAMEGRAKF